MNYCIFFVIVHDFTYYMHKYTHTNDRHILRMCSTTLSKTYYNKPRLNPFFYIQRYAASWNAKYARLSFDVSPGTILKLTLKLKLQLLMKRTPDGNGLYNMHSHCRILIICHLLICRTLIDPIAMFRAFPSNLGTRGFYVFFQLLERPEMLQLRTDLAEIVHNYNRKKQQFLMIKQDLSDNLDLDLKLYKNRFLFKKFNNSEGQRF